MIQVSNAWKEFQTQTLLPEMFVEITCTVTEPGLQGEAVAQATSPEPFSDLGQIVDVENNVSEAYAALDYGVWGLDGNFKYSNGNPKNPGYVNAQYSDENGSSQATITIDLAKRHTVSIPGITIVWSEIFGGWATDFRVRTYNSGGLVSQITVNGNTSPVSELWFELIDYTQIQIDVLGWSHPFQRIRCNDITLGIKLVYTKDDLLSYEHGQSVDLLSATLPKNEIKFSLRNDDNRWNPDNPTNIEQYLLEQQEVKVRYGMDVNGEIEWIKGGTFWLSEWETPSNGMEAMFTARDATGFMVSTYNGPRSGTLYELAVAAFTQADLEVMDDGSERYVLSSSLKETSVNFTEDTTEYTIADVLQLIAHAGNCVFYQDRNGLLHIEPWARVYSGYVLEQDVCYTHPEYTTNKPLKAVSVKYGENSRVTLNVDSRGEIQTVDNPLIDTEAHAILVGEHTREILTNRKVISGDFRADLRLDVLDNIIVTSKYASNIIGITEMKYSTNGGAFKGTYTGRVVSVKLSPAFYYSGDIHVGEA